MSTTATHSSLEMASYRSIDASLKGSSDGAKSEEQEEEDRAAKQSSRSGKYVFPFLSAFLLLRLLLQINRIKIMELARGWRCSCTYVY